jgi:methylase of polypeptide subunit release factors/tRNA A-37 threonylcarbamoyl transferase component Bud32
MPEERFELSRLSPYASETYAYTNSATRARPAQGESRFSSIAIFILSVNLRDGKKSGLLDYLYMYMLYFLHNFMKSPLIIVIITAFIFNTLCPLSGYADTYISLPRPGVMVHLSPDFNPPVLKGLKVHTDDPFRFDFIMDRGDSLEAINNRPYLKEESTKLIKYFLVSLTIPEKDLWVNLSPYERNRIIPDSFGLTDMGRDLLAEDYMLKQITASLIYPEDDVGKKFWKRIYQEAQAKYHTTNIPVNTFNKVWIVPEKAVVFENAKAGTAYVVESKLKVMLEEDYVSMAKHDVGDGSPVPQKGGETPPVQKMNNLGSQIVREIVLPALETEVNEGKNFAQLRQVYNSLILATWYKKKIKDSILSKVYADQNKIAGVNIQDPKEKERIYEQYLQAFKKGVYNYIKEEPDPITNQPISRKYFSGGVKWDMAMMSTTADAAMLPTSSSNAIVVESNFQSASNVSTASAGDNKPITFNIEGKQLIINQENGVVKGDYYTDFVMEKLSELFKTFRKEKAPLGDVLELGTGRGVLINAIGLITDPSTKLFANDVNEQAVLLARRNAQANGLSQRVNISQGRFFEGVSQNQSFDLVISNLPMIPTDPQKYQDQIGKGDFVIIDGGPDGRKNVDLVIGQSSRFVNTGGSLLIVQPDFIGVQKTLDLLASQGFEGQIIARQSKLLKETIYTQANKEYISKVGSYQFHKKEDGQEYFDMVLIRAKKVKAFDLKDSAQVAHATTVKGMAVFDEVIENNPEYEAKVQKLNDDIDQIFRDYRSTLKTSPSNYHYIDKLTYLIKSFLDNSPRDLLELASEFENKIIPQLKEINHPLVEILPTFDHWLAYAVMGLDDNYLIRIKAISQIYENPLASAIIFAANGPHTRREFVDTDKNDVEAQIQLIDGFIGHLQYLFNKLEKPQTTPEVENETRMYAGALLNGLLIRRHINRREFIRNLMGLSPNVDFKKMIRKSLDLFPEKIPEFLHFTGETFGNDQINDLATWNVNFPSRKATLEGVLFGSPSRGAIAYMKDREAKAREMEDTESLVATKLKYRNLRKDFLENDDSSQFNGKADHAMVVYNPQALAQDRRSPAEIFLSHSLEYDDVKKARIIRDFNRLALTFFIKDTKSYNEQNRDEEFQKIFDDMERFSQLAYTDNPLNNEARVFLWKMGEIAFDITKDMLKSRFDSKLPVEYFDEKTKGLPILDLASGPRAMYFMKQYPNEHLILADVSYFVEALLNKAKSYFGLGDNVIVRRVDLNDTENLFQEPAYRFIRLGNLDYIKNIQPDLLENLLYEVSPGGAISYEYPDGGAHPSLVQLNGLISQRPNRWTIQREYEQPGLGPEEKINYVLFIKKADQEDQKDSAQLSLTPVAERFTPQEVVNKVNDLVDFETAENFIGRLNSVDGLKGIVYQSDNAWHILMALERLDQLLGSEGLDQFQKAKVKGDPEYIAKIRNLNQTLDQIAKEQGFKFSREISKLNYIEKFSSILNQTLTSSNPLLVEELSSTFEDIVDQLKRLDHPLMVVLPNLDDWLAYASMPFSPVSKKYVDAVKGLARLKGRPAASALLFAANGAHTRADFRNTDKDDIEAQMVLVDGFVPYLNENLERLNHLDSSSQEYQKVEAEVKKYGGALFNGLLVRSDQWSLVQEMAERLKASKQIDLIKIVKELAQRSPREMPDFLHYVGERLGDLEINRFAYWNKKNNRKATAEDLFWGSLEAEQYRREMEPRNRALMEDPGSIGLTQMQYRHLLDNAQLALDQPVRTLNSSKADQAMVVRLQWPKEQLPNSSAEFDQRMINNIIPELSTIIRNIPKSKPASEQKVEIANFEQLFQKLVSFSEELGIKEQITLSIQELKSRSELDPFELWPLFFQLNQTLITRGWIIDSAGDGQWDISWEKINGFVLMKDKDGKDVIIATVDDEKRLSNTGFGLLGNSMARSLGPPYILLSKKLTTDAELIKKYKEILEATKRFPDSPTKYFLSRMKFIKENDFARFRKHSALVEEWVHHEDKRTYAKVFESTSDWKKAIESVLLSGPSNIFIDSINESWKDYIHYLQQSGAVSPTDIIQATMELRAYLQILFNASSEDELRYLMSFDIYSLATMKKGSREDFIYGMPLRFLLWGIENVLKGQAASFKNPTHQMTGQEFPFLMEGHLYEKIKNKSPFFNVYTIEDSAQLALEQGTNNDLETDYSNVEQLTRLGIYGGIKDYLKNLFKTSLSEASSEEKITDPQVLTDTITKIIVGTRDTRLGALPTPENDKIIRDRIRQSIENNLPIEVSMLWAPKKHFVSGADSMIDVAEVIALQTIYNICLQVRRIYSPGLRYTLYLEDFEMQFIEGNAPSFETDRSNYMDGLKKLIQILKVDSVINAVKVSDLAKTSQERAMWETRIEENYQRLKDYWFESEQKGIDGYENYESYKALIKLGWKGPIPQIMRNYYRARVSRLLGEDDSKKVDDMILRNFAGILLHYQTKMLRTPGDIEPLKFSFVPEAPGTLEDFQRGRIDIRPIPSSITRTSMPPWTGQGLLRIKDGRITPQFRSWHELMDPSRLIHGHIIFKRGKESVMVRTDFLLDENQKDGAQLALEEKVQEIPTQKIQDAIAEASHWPGAELNWTVAVKNLAASRAFTMERYGQMVGLMIVRKGTLTSLSPQMIIDGIEVRRDAQNNGIGRALVTKVAELSLSDPETQGRVSLELATSADEGIYKRLHFANIDSPRGAEEEGDQWHLMSLTPLSARWLVQETDRAMSNTLSAGINLDIVTDDSRELIEKDIQDSFSGEVLRAIKEQGRIIGIGKSIDKGNGEVDVVQVQSSVDKKLLAIQRRSGEMQKEFYSLTPQNVPQVYYSQRQEKASPGYMVNDFIPGKNLEEEIIDSYIKERGRLTKEDIKGILKEVGRVLGVWNKNHYAHGDLQLRHIFLRQKTPVIIDYHLASSGEYTDVTKTLGFIEVNSAAKEKEIQELKEAFLEGYRENNDNPSIEEAIFLREIMFVALKENMPGLSVAVKPWMFANGYTRVNEANKLFERSRRPYRLKVDERGSPKAYFVPTGSSVQVVGKNDYAMNPLMDEEIKNRGGIDFTADKTPLEIKNQGKGIKFHIDPAMLQQLQNAPGFVPVIVQMTPLNDLRSFLGIVVETP